MPSSQAVITGLGIVSSIGIGCEDFFDALLQGRSGVCSLSQRTDGGAQPDCPPLEQTGDQAGLWIGAPILDFDPKQYVRPRKALKVMCREIQTAFAAAQLSIQQADLESCLPASDDSLIAPARIGTVLGGEMYFGPPEDMVDPIRDCVEEDGTLNNGKFGAAARRGVMPLWMLKYLPNMPACHIGISINAHGPNNSLILGDVSGPAALMEAVSYISRDLCDVVLTGATGTLINSTRLNYRNDLPLPTVVDPIENSSRPNDPDSTGVVGGEGATSIVVEKASHAADRGATVIAEIAACVSRFSPAQAMSDAPRRSTQEGQVGRGSAIAIGLAIRAALQQADITASQIGLIVSHASGDPEVDAAEQAAIVKHDLDSIPLVTPMSLIGHTGAASGSMAIVVGALALQKATIPMSQVRLTQSYALCLAHTPEGSATAVILKSPK